jgi:ketosteroid isomerase-like protein
MERTAAMSGDTITAVLQPVLQEFLDAIDAADLEALERLWCRDASMYFPFAKTPELHAGREAILARFARMFGDLRARNPGGAPYVRFRVLAFDCIEIGERHAIVYATLGFSRQTGRRTIVLRREPDGWRLLHVHASNFEE